MPDLLHSLAQHLNGHGQRFAPDQLRAALDLEKARMADLITLPESVKGTSCVSCLYVDGDYCKHPKVSQKLLDGAARMCCFLPGNDVLPVGEVLAGSKAWYSGEAIEICTLTGHSLALTVNHPVFSEYGKVMAGQVNEGDNLVCCQGGDKPVCSSHPANYQQKAPVSIEQVLHSLEIMSLAVFHTVEISGVDFHGDGASIYGKVYIVRADRALRRGVNSTTGEIQGNIGLANAGLCQGLAPGQGNGLSFLLGQCSSRATHGSDGTSGSFLPGFVRSICPDFDNSFPNVFCVPGLCGQVHSLPFGRLDFPFASQRHSCFFESRCDYPSADASRFLQLLNGFAGQVTTDQVIKIRRFHYEGPVYDVETTTGAIVANGVLVSNCALWDNAGARRAWESPISNDPGGHLEKQEEEIAAHPDDKAAEQLLDTSRRQGTRVMEDATRSAVERILAEGGARALLRAKHLFDVDEKEALADSLARVNSTADLLGRVRIRLREGAHKRSESFSSADPTPFAELPSLTPGVGLNALSYQSFAEPLKPLPPLKALEWFSGLVPSLRRLKGDDDGETWERDWYEKAFSLAADTDLVLLDKIKSAIRKAIEEGRAYTGARDVQQLLEDAGVARTVGGKKVTPAYSRLVLDTNMKESYRHGSQQEMKEKDVQAAFPAWSYANPDDDQSRPEHAARNGKYYPASASFFDVRGHGSNVFGCRCLQIPVSNREWQRLSAAGARLETSW